MRCLIVLVFLFLVSCQPKKVYDDTEFEEISKKNGVISPYGTYSAQAINNTFYKPALFLDSQYLRLVYLDSSRNEISINGQWVKQSFDTQSFSFDFPFKKAILDSDGLYFLDSTGEQHLFEKTADSIITMPIKDSINIKP